MNQSQAQKLLTKLEPYLEQIREEISTSERRLSIAKGTADSLESRNKQAIEEIESKAKLRDEALKAESANLKAKLSKDTDKAKQVLNDLIDEVSKLNFKRTDLIAEIDSLTVESDTIKSQVSDKQAELTDIDSKIETGSEDVNSLLAQKENIHAEIKELNDSRDYLKEDLRVLNDEAEIVETNIIEFDAQYKERKKYLDGLLSDTQLKLKKALDSLQEAQDKDKQMREDWADGQMKLDKREQAVRRMEAKVSGAESRIAELGRYDGL